MRTNEDPFSLIGVGLYTWSEAARLVGVRAVELRRWLRGYSFPGKDAARHMPPLWERDLASADVDGMSFQDLLEARVVLALRQEGLSLQFIRRAREMAGLIFGTPHPFSTNFILTDGRSVFAQTPAEREGKERVLDIVRRQLAFNKVLAPSLRGVVFDENERAIRWFPMPRREAVVIDPKIAFGKPIVTEGHVRTDILADAVTVEGSKLRVARLYEVPLEAVEAAVDFEQRLAA